MPAVQKDCMQEPVRGRVLVAEWEGGVLVVAAGTSGGEWRHLKMV